MTSIAPQAQPPQPTIHKGIVKQVLSGDSLIIRGQPKGGPPPEKQLCLSNITARKLARRPNPNADESVESKDEPYAWEAREFLRRKLVGKEVAFTIEYKVPGTGREYGCVFLGKSNAGENITELLVSEGLVEVRRGGIKPSDDQQKLCELEDIAKSLGKGIWGKDSPQDHVRDVKWVINNPRNFVDSLHQKPMKAVVEHVRDGSTVRVFLLPDFQYLTVMISGIRCPMFKVSDGSATPYGETFAEEAKYFTESRLLQRDVEVILESVANNNFLGSIKHPNGDISEVLLREGFARCVDWSMAFVSSGVEKLRAAERVAKEGRLRVWKDYNPTGLKIDAKDKEFTAKVMEVANADALVVKPTEGTTLKKIFLASIRPPRLQDTQQVEPPKDPKNRQFRPLYDIPYMYEAREFLRTKLIGKKIHVIVDYIQPASSSFPEKTCCTVTISGSNVAEVLVSKGLATVVRYRQDDDQRSSRYDDLLSAENKAIKTASGVHAKKDTPIHRVADISGDLAKAKQFLPFLQRAGKTDAVVEYVSSGSRLRLYVPKETCLITFLLGGINCPKGARPLPGGGATEADPFGEEAFAFTKELCMQREVEIEVESMDKAGNFIGWLWIDGTNLSVALVKEGLATVHGTAERSVHYKSLQLAEDSARDRKEKLWAGYEESVEQIIPDDSIERAINHVSVVITEVRQDLHFYAQHVEQGPQLEELMQQLRDEFSANPPLPGAYTPKRGDLCAAKFVDGEWYRAKVEKTSPNDVYIFYVDYGNRETTKPTNLATLPANFQGMRPAAHEYALACVQLHSDPDYQQDSVHAFSSETQNQTFLLNVEYKTGGIEYVTLYNSDTKEDIIKGLVAEGLMLFEQRKEKRLQKVVSEYKTAQDLAKKKRLNIWQYGDFTEDDDAKEFGFQQRK